MICKKNICIYISYSHQLDSAMRKNKIPFKSFDENVKKKCSCIDISVHTLWGYYRSVVGTELTVLLTRLLVLISH